MTAVDFALQRRQAPEVKADESVVNLKGTEQEAIANLRRLIQASAGANFDENTKKIAELESDSKQNGSIGFVADTETTSIFSGSEKIKMDQRAANNWIDIISILNADFDTKIAKDAKSGHKRSYALSDQTGIAAFTTAINISQGEAQSGDDSNLKPVQDEAKALIAKIMNQAIAGSASRDIVLNSTVGSIVTLLTANEDKDSLLATFDLIKNAGIESFASTDSKYLKKIKSLVGNDTVGDVIVNAIKTKIDIFLAKPLNQEQLDLLNTNSLEEDYQKMKLGITEDVSMRTDKLIDKLSPDKKKLLLEDPEFKDLVTTRRKVMNELFLANTEDEINTASVAYLKSVASLEGQREPLVASIKDLDTLKTKLNAAKTAKKLPIVITINNNYLRGAGASGLRVDWLQQEYNLAKAALTENLAEVKRKIQETNLDSEVHTKLIAYSNQQTPSVDIGTSSAKVTVETASLKEALAGKGNEVAVYTTTTPVTVIYPAIKDLVAAYNTAYPSEAIPAADGQQEALITKLNEANKANTPLVLSGLTFNTQGLDELTKSGATWDNTGSFNRPTPVGNTPIKTVSLSELRTILANEEKASRIANAQSNAAANKNLVESIETLATAYGAGSSSTVDFTTLKTKVTQPGVDLAKFDELFYGSETKDAAGKPVFVEAQARLAGDWNFIYRGDDQKDLATSLSTMVVKVKKEREAYRKKLDTVVTTMNSSILKPIFKGAKVVASSLVQKLLTTAIKFGADEDGSPKGEFMDAINTLLGDDIKQEKAKLRNEASDDARGIYEQEYIAATKGAYKKLGGNTDSAEALLSKITGAGDYEKAITQIVSNVETLSKRSGSGISKLSSTDIAKLNEPITNLSEYDKHAKQLEQVKIVLAVLAEAAKSRGTNELKTYGTNIGFSTTNHQFFLSALNTIDQSIGSKIKQMQSKQAEHEAIKDIEDIAELPRSSSIAKTLLGKASNIIKKLCMVLGVTIQDIEPIVSKFEASKKDVDNDSPEGVVKNVLTDVIQGLRSSGTAAASSNKTEVKAA